MDRAQDNEVDNAVLSDAGNMGTTEAFGVLSRLRQSCLTSSRCRRFKGRHFQRWGTPGDSVRVQSTGQRSLVYCPFAVAPQVLGDPEDISPLLLARVMCLPRHLSNRIGYIGACRVRYPHRPAYNLAVRFFAHLFLALPGAERHQSQSRGRARCLHSKLLLY